MSTITITQAQITLATTDLSTMVPFYTSVFALDLQPFSAYGTTLYHGTLHNVAFVLCPNTLANVQADQSRHQLTYTVSDLEALIERVLVAGGTVQEHTPTTERPANAVVRDPDGNSIVFIQAIDLPTV